MIFDVHAHLDMFDDESLKELISRAKLEGVKIIITNSVNMKSIFHSLEISKKYPKIVRLAIGLYPEKDLKLEEWGKFEEFARKNKDQYIAFGEIGLDLFSTTENFNIQKEIFIKELNLAKELSKPVIIHTRKAEKEVLDILENYPGLKKVLHCFSGNFKLIKRAKEMGCYFSIPANVNHSEHFQKMVKELPRKIILTETDSPYLSPYKEGENEPSFIKETIFLISNIWNTSKKEVEKQIETNYKEIFGTVM